jgi:hypothetical protein
MPIIAALGEVDIGGSGVQGQLGLHSKVLSQKKILFFSVFLRKKL